MNQNGVNRYGEAYARTLSRLADKTMLVTPQEDLRPGELFNDTHPEYVRRLDHIQERVTKFLSLALSSPAYDLESTGAAKEQAALDECIILYAMGGVDDKGVEACARVYLRACKRPDSVPTERVERGSANPPPSPGTYGGKVQAGYRKQMSRPPSIARIVDLSIERIDREGAVIQELDPDTWRYAVLLVDHEPSPFDYFRTAPLKSGAYGYAKLSPHSLISYPERPELWAVQFYSPEALLSYYFKTPEIEAHAPADNQDAIDKAWSRGFQSKK